jgi:ATP-binding cassette subfamily C protein
MLFLYTLIRKYPKQSIIMLLAMIIAGVVEGFGLSAIIPLLSTAISEQVGADQMAAAGLSVGHSTAEHMVRETFEALGLPPTLEVFLIVIFCAIILKSVVLFIANIRVGYTVAQIATDLRLEFLRHLLVSRWEFYLRQPVGVLTTAIGESGRASKGYESGAMMAASIVQVLVCLGVAFLISWQATLVAIGAGSLIILLLKRFMKRSRDAGERRTRVNKSLVRYFIDSLQSIKPIKAMAQERLAESVLFKHTNKLNKALRRQVVNKEYLRAFQEPMRLVFLLIGFYVVLILFRFPLASVMVLFILVARVLIQLGKVMEQYQNVVFFESGFWSVQEKLRKVKNAREAEHGKIPPTLDKEIRLDRITFAYGEKGVLQDISLTFPAGLITSIVGSSGTGKTTIVDLVIGLLRPAKGEIWIDNLPLAQIDLQKWRRLIGYVPQDTWLLHDTILNNITFGDPEINENAVAQALRDAGAWEFVSTMPKGIHSTVGERGGKISGGQRQRIAIARALVRKPKLLILDEATTSLDPENEKAICNTLAQLRGELTILAISHQAAVLEVADQAYRLQNGKAAPVIDIHSTASLKSDAILTDSELNLAVAANPGKLK